MKSAIVKITIDNIPAEIKINKNTNFGMLKETLRDQLIPRIKTPQNWGKIIETIRDTALPHLQ